ncbi:MAG: COX15/CtaA family protein, partial [Woeseiaceae bacterium]
MRALAITCLGLVLLLVSLSAYLRLEHSGIGCSPWPECYGNIGVERPDTALHERLIEDATNAASWATPLHRLVATVLGVLVLALAFLAILKKRDRSIVAALLLLTVYLAVVGAISGSLRNPAIVMGNLVGGFGMLALLGWMVLRRPLPSSAPPALHRITVLALLFLGLQILLGGLTSANFAASACVTLPDCQGSWLPGRHLGVALDITRQHVVNESGFVVGGPERADIHKLHRLVACLTAVLILACGVFAIRTGPALRNTAL